MVLQPSKVHVDDFKIVTNTGQEIEAARNITYRGYLSEDTSVRIRATITNGFIQGRIYDDEIYAFETVRHEKEGLLLAIYKEGLERTAFNVPRCGNHAEQLQQVPPSFQPQNHRGHNPNGLAPFSGAEELAAAASNGDKVVLIGPAVDWQAYYGKVNQNAAAFNIELQAMVNYMNEHYATYGVAYQITPIYFITSSPNPWTDYPGGNGDSNRLSFEAWARSSNGFPYECEAPMLFTGQDFGQISWATIGAMCQSWGSIQIDYHINTSISTQHRSNIMSHEMGHYWGAYHISGIQYYMSGSIYPGNLIWSSTSYNVISNSVQAATCLPLYSSCNGVGDADGDGICSDMDCDDNNAQINSLDADDDGICSDLDCDDNNAAITFADVDGDGICSDIDCDDNDAQVTSADADGDGLCSDIDCDDTDGLPTTCNEYCIPEHVNCCNEYLENVSLNTLNNSSYTPLHSDNHTGYSDYTNLSTTLYRGNIYSITVTPSYSWSSSKAGVWIDWNNDQVFSNDENILSTGGVGPWAASFTVPAGAVQGTTRMRVRLQYGSDYTPDPCGYSYYYNGETEDYSIQVGTEGYCDDGDPNTVSVDADGDGLCSNVDCNDNDAQVTTIDADGDGICGDEDCDDNDVNITSVDADGDGVCSDLDCDDNNALVTSFDSDGDGICSDMDCDDNDAGITTLDADADGICSNLDCDDTDGIPTICDNYCTPIHIRCCNERITNVSLNTLNNSSGYPLHSNNTTGYSDYTSLTTSLQTGNTYSITVTPSYSWSSSKAGVWIDWNHDQVFSNDENILSTGGAGPWAASFTVPANANSGTTRMRVRLQYGYNYTPDPCDYSYYYNGETEDYSIYVSNAGMINTGETSVLSQARTSEKAGFWAYPNPARDQLWVKYSATKNQAVTLSLIDQLGRAVKRSEETAAKGENTYLFGLHNLKAGVYLIRLKSDDGYQVKKILIN